MRPAAVPRPVRAGGGDPPGPEERDDDDVVRMPRRLRPLPEHPRVADRQRLRPGRRRQGDRGQLHPRLHGGRGLMKILYTPVMIVPSLDAVQRAAILDAAGPGATLVETKDPARQRAEIVDADVLFGRVPNDVFLLHKKLSYYHSIGAGVDAILSPELVRSDIPLASEQDGD